MPTDPATVAGATGRAATSRWSARSSRHGWSISVRTRGAGRTAVERRGCSRRSVTDAAARDRAVGRTDGRSGPRRRGGTRAAGAEPAGRQWGDAAGGSSGLPPPCATRPACARCSIITAPAFVETPDEIDALMQDRSRRSSGCVSTPAMRPTAEARRSSCCRATARGSGTSTSRTASRTIAERARQERWDYQTALRHGALLRAGARQRRFSRVAPRPSAIRATTAGSSSSRTSCRHGRAGRSATRNRQYLRSIGL